MHDELQSCHVARATRSVTVSVRADTWIRVNFVAP